MELSLAIHTPNSVEKKTEIIDTAEKNIKYQGMCTNVSLLILRKVLLNTFIR